MWNNCWVVALEEWVMDTREVINNFTTIGGMVKIAPKIIGGYQN